MRGRARRAGHRGDRRRGRRAHPRRRRGGRAAALRAGGRRHRRDAGRGRRRRRSARPTSPARSPRWSGRTRPRARGHDLVLLGNDAADSGDFQVGIRLAYELGRPVVNGAKVVSVADGVVTARVEGPEGAETYQVPLPAVVTIREGGVEPRYPSVPGRMKAKKVPVEERTPSAEPTGPKRVKLTAAAAGAEQRADPGRGRRRRARRRRPVRGAGGAGPMILTLVEKNLDGSAVEVSLEALTFARTLSAAGGGVPVDASSSSAGERLRRAAQGAGGVRRPQRPPGRRRRARGVLRRRLGLGDPGRARAEQGRSW